MTIRHEFTFREMTPDGYCVEEIDLIAEFDAPYAAPDRITRQAVKVETGQAGRSIYYKQVPISRGSDLWRAASMQLLHDVELDAMWDRMRRGDQREAAEARRYRLKIREGV